MFISLRRFVLGLIEHPDIKEIDDALVQIALDENEDQVLRRLAARHIREVGSVETKLRLKPYIYGREDDPEDDLKGYALQALWPEALTASELFNAITPPKRQNYLGSYRIFLLEDSVLTELQVTDLPIALEWIAALPAHHEVPISLRNLPGKIMRHAWDNINAPGVMEAFANTAVAIMTRFDGLFNETSYSYPPDQGLDNIENAFVANTKVRRELALKCLPHLLDKDRRASSLVRCWPPIVVADDLDWLLELLDAENTEARRVQLAQLVASLFGHLHGQDIPLSERYHNIEKVYNAGERHPELKERTAEFFISRFDDPVVVSHSDHHRKMKEIEENRQQELAEVRPFERLEEALDRSEAGETLMWQNVIGTLSHSPDRRHDSWNWNPDLTDFPLWKLCDGETRERILKAADYFAVHQDVVYTTENTEDWYDTSSVPYIELHGYLALFLLLKVDASSLYWLPPERWEHWSKVIVWYPDSILLGDGRADYLRELYALQQDLLRRLHENAPRALLDNLKRLLLSEDRRDSYISQTLHKVEHIWNSKFERMFLEILHSLNLSPKGQRAILDFLLTQQSVEAIRFAEAQISSGHTSQIEKDRVVESSVSLMLSGSEFDRSLVWRLLQNHDAVGRAIVEKLADEDWNETRFVNELSAPELVDLFIWIEEQYPTREDPEVDGVQFVTAREQVGRLRYDLIIELRNRNNPEALDGIWWILSQFPELEWLEFVRIDLEKAVEGSEPEPTSPKDITKRLSRYQGPRLSTVEQVKRVFKKHAGTVLTVAGFVIRRLLGS